MDGAEIAVVVPTYRRTDRALRMIDALEAQTVDPSRFEVLVVDDRSDDGTYDLLVKRAETSHLAVRVLTTERNGGPAGARNLGWRTATAPLVAFVDDDCVPDPMWLAAGLDALATDTRAGVLQGRTLRPDGATLGDWSIWREVLQASPYFEGCNLFLRRAALEATGGFDEALGLYGEDTMLGWAAIAAGWERGFVDAAVVRHDVEERGVRWRVRWGYRERRNLMAVAARHPEFRQQAFWRLSCSPFAATNRSVGTVPSLRLRNSLCKLFFLRRWFWFSFMP